jgi:hypothetical protein
MKIWMVLSMVSLIGVFLMGCQTSRAGYASAPYQVLRSDGKFELRDYPALTLVETPMRQAAKGADGGFMRLFGFISGGNAAKQKIAMTTPVLMSGSEEARTMAFVMPANMKRDQVPKPADRSVTVRGMAAARFAVLRYRGGRNAGQEARSLAELKAWMAAQNLAQLSGPVYGYFDPPWTPTVLRHNEVMLQTKADP